jgi:hypothetical protein
MARRKKIPVSVQEVAVKQWIKEGKTLDEIAKDFPDFKEGVDSVRGTTPTKTGSGSRPSKPVDYDL